MFRFVKQIFISPMFFGCNLSCINPLKCISMNNQEEDQKLLMLIVMKLHFFDPVTAVVDEIISMIHMQNCVPDVVKNIKFSVFNLMSRTNETRHIEHIE